MKSRLLYILFLVSLVVGCAPGVPPYAHGPVMSKKDIGKTFLPILQFMEIRPGLVFADVGAGSGAITVMMSSLLDSATIYIQDIDTTVLASDNVNKIIEYYSKETGRDLKSKRSYHLIIGTPDQTRLPDKYFDRIYTNGTMHVFTSPDSIINDIKMKLKPTGMLFVRDTFKNDHGEGSFCSDRNCAKPLLTIDEFLALMERNGFELKKRAPDMSGYPLFGFALQN